MIQYEVPIAGGDCHDERRAHIVSTRLPDSPGWSAHVFRCEECRSERVVYSTLIDPREWAKKTPEEMPHPCQYCHEPVDETAEDACIDPIACFYAHRGCLPPRKPPRAIRGFDLQGRPL